MEWRNILNITMATEFTQSTKPNSKVDQLYTHLNISGYSILYVHIPVIIFRFHVVRLQAYPGHIRQDMKFTCPTSKT